MMQYVVQKAPTWFDNVKTWIHNAVEGVVNWFSEHKVAVLIGALALVAIFLGPEIAAGAMVAFNTSFSQVLATSP